MKWSILATAAMTAGVASSQGLADPQLVGTWSSKSQSVTTGPDFYDPASEKLIEPKHTGISYSFTADGFYETALYRAIANPADPACPQGMIQWQHGSYEKFPNGSLVLTPIAVDGRQLISNPCEYDTSILTRYNQTELFERYDVQSDHAHNGVLRLDIFQFDGSPMMPLYLLQNQPDMLPTTTLNPTNKPTGKKGAAATHGSKAKRSLDEGIPLNFPAINQPKTFGSPDHWWWVGVLMTGVGGVLFFCV